MEHDDPNTIFRKICVSLEKTLKFVSFVTLGVSLEMGQ